MAWYILENVICVAQGSRLEILDSKVWQYHHPNTLSPSLGTPAHIGKGIKTTKLIILL